MQASDGSNAEHRPGAESPDAFTITDLARWNIHCLQDCYLLPTRINDTLNRMDNYKPQVESQDDDLFVDDDPTQVISIAELPDLEFDGKKRRAFVDALRSFFGRRPLELLQ